MGGSASFLERCWPGKRLLRRWSWERGSGSPHELLCQEHSGRVTPMGGGEGRACSGAGAQQPPGPEHKRWLPLPGGEAEGEWKLQSGLWPYQHVTLPNAGACAFSPPPCPPQLPHPSTSPVSVPLAGERGAASGTSAAGWVVLRITPSL